MVARHHSGIQQFKCREGPCSMHGARTPPGHGALYDTTSRVRVCAPAARRNSCLRSAVGTGVRCNHRRAYGADNNDDCTSYVHLERIRRADRNPAERTATAPLDHRWCDRLHRGHDSHNVRGEDSGYICDILFDERHHARHARIRNTHVNGSKRCHRRSERGRLANVSCRCVYSDGTQVVEAVHAARGCERDNRGSGTPTQAPGRFRLSSLSQRPSASFLAHSPLRP